MIYNFSRSLQRSLLLHAYVWLAWSRLNFYRFLEMINHMVISPFLKNLKEAFIGPKPQNNFPPRHPHLTVQSCSGLSTIFRDDQAQEKSFAEPTYSFMEIKTLFVLQYLMVKELYNLTEKAHRLRQKELSEKRKPPKWFFFFVATFWQYFRWVHTWPLVFILGDGL